MKKLKDLALHLPLAGLERSSSSGLASSSSSPVSSPRRPTSPTPLLGSSSPAVPTAAAARSPHTSVADEAVVAPSVTTPASTGSAAAAVAPPKPERKKGVDTFLTPLQLACRQGDLNLINSLLFPPIDGASGMSAAAAAAADPGEPVPSGGADGGLGGWLPVHLLLASRALPPLSAHPPDAPVLQLLSALLHSPTKGTR